MAKKNYGHTIRRLVLAVNPALTPEEHNYAQNLLMGIVNLHAAFTGAGVQSQEVLLTLKDAYEHYLWYNKKRNPEDPRPVELGTLFSQLATLIDPLMKKHDLMNSIGLSDRIPKDILSKLPSLPLRQNPRVDIPEDQKVALKGVPQVEFLKTDLGKALSETTDERQNRWKKWKDSTPGTKAPKQPPPQPEEGTEGTEGTKNALIRSLLKKGDAVTDDAAINVNTTEGLKQFVEKKKQDAEKSKQVAQKSQEVASKVEEIDNII